MKNIIVITGGAGFIGSNLIKFLIKKTKYKILSIDNYSTGSKNNHCNSSRVKYINSNNIYIEKKLSKIKNKILTLFHFGEFSRIYQSFTDIIPCYNSNMLGTFSVVKFCSDNKIKLIYSASSSKFGNKGKDENLSPYSWTKSKNIELIENYNKWFDLRYEILYFYNVYGPGQIKKSKMAAVIAIFEEQYKNKKSLTVVKPGTQKRDFTHINDIVNGCFLAFKKGKNDHYFLGSKKSYKILDIAKMFKTKIKMVPERKGERLGSFYKKSNTERHLNFKTTINIEDYIFSLINKH
ncbi:MAG: NAD-dependent epimerase/dehydratase family protein [Candidatus Fonsibacter sp.]|nr:NAD-dependent epimerase/dehydratase family protein [Candidatus Fonsibacter sp.]